jgi:DNA-binding response OmpR family regulator
LIVEDDAVILNTLAYNLTRQGFGVHKATSGPRPSSSPASSGRTSSCST